MKKLLISWLVTPKRVRKLIAKAVSWFLYRCMIKGAWDVISTFPRWLRRLADFIDQWNATELPEDKDRLITELVVDAITDEDIDKLLAQLTAVKQAAIVVVPEIQG